MLFLQFVIPNFLFVVHIHDYSNIVFGKFIQGDKIADFNKSSILEQVLSNTA